MNTDCSRTIPQDTKVSRPWRRSQRRIFLIAAIALAGPFVVFLAAKNFSDRSYAARLEKIRTEGNPTTPQELAEWNKQLSVTKDIREDNVPLTKTAWDNRVLKTEVLPENTSADSAHTVVEFWSQQGEKDLEVFDAPEDLEMFDVLGRFDAEGSLSPEDQDKLKLFLKKNGTLLRLLHEAAALPPGQFALDYTKEDRMGLPYCHHVLDSMDLLQIEAVHTALAGDTDGAFNALTSIMAIYQPFKQVNILLPRMISLANSSIVLHSFARTLGHVTYNENQLSQLQHSFESEYDPEALANTFITERVFGIAAFNDPVGRGNMHISWLSGLPHGISDTVVRTANAFGWYTQKRDYYLDSMDTLIRAARRPYGETQQILPAIETTGGPVPPGLPDAFVPTLCRVIDENTEYKTRLDQGVVAAAIERYRLAQGTPPNRLESLVPGYLDNIPLDPFDEQPLRYRREGEGYVVYSIGANLADDGGVNGGTVYEEDVVFQVRRKS